MLDSKYPFENVTMVEASPVDRYLACSSRGGTFFPGPSFLHNNKHQVYFHHNKQSEKPVFDSSRLHA
jgi:hypothetical protein